MFFFKKNINRLGICSNHSCVIVEHHSRVLVEHHSRTSVEHHSRTLVEHHSHTLVEHHSRVIWYENSTQPIESVETAIGQIAMHVRMPKILMSILRVILC